MYLLAIVAANLGVAAWGKVALLATGFLLIPFDLVTRDVLHHEWSRTGGVLWKMAALIIAGSAISFAINAGALRVAIASCVSFGVAATIDTLAYHICRGQSRFFRSNTSNVFSAFADSIIFPAILFGSLPLGIVLGQFGLKLGGSVIWAFVFFRNKGNRYVHNR